VSSLTTDKGIVHYEVYGRGRPVILLHGWLGSWGLWQNTMEHLGQFYRTYALDFWGFGDSGKKNSSYALDDFVKLVDQFMEELGIGQAPIVGHSMGGTVSLSLAIQYPQRVTKVAVIGSPIDGKSLAALLKLAGYRPIAVVVYNLMWALKFGIKLSSPMITKEERWYQMIDKDLSKTTVESFLTSISSLHRTNLTHKIQSITVPIMGIYGNKDIIVNPAQWKPLKENLPNAQIEWFENAGHFPMLDQPEVFQKTLLEFLEKFE
jgi:pimeloyl-ACP methyl ester carboxylesterase